MAATAMPAAAVTATAMPAAAVAAAVVAAAVVAATVVAAVTGAVGVSDPTIAKPFEPILASSLAPVAPPRLQLLKHLLTPLLPLPHAVGGGGAIDGDGQLLRRYFETEMSSHENTIVALNRRHCHRQRRQFQHSVHLAAPRFG